MRDGGRRRVAVPVVDEHLDAVADEHLERRPPGRFGETVGVAADEERTVEPLVRAVVADGLCRGEDVVLVERRPQAGAAVTGGAEGDLLVGVLDVRVAVVVGAHEGIDVDEVLGQGDLSGSGVAHDRPSFPAAAEVLEVVVGSAVVSADESGSGAVVGSPGSTGCTSCPAPPARPGARATRSTAGGPSRRRHTADRATRPPAPR